MFDKSQDLIQTFMNSFSREIFKVNSRQKLQAIVIYCGSRVIIPGQCHLIWVDCHLIWV